MEEKYYLLGHLVCRIITNGDDVTTEYYKVGEGWHVDKPGADYRNINQAIGDAKHDYGDFSIGDIADLTEEQANIITSKQEELGRNDIPGLVWGGGYFPENK